MSIRMSVCVRALAPAALAALAVAPVEGAIIAYEGFAGMVTNSPLHGQTTSGIGFAATNAWNSPAAPSAAGYTVAAASLGYSNGGTLATTGDKVNAYRTTSATNAYPASLSMNPAITSNTWKEMFFSFLIDGSSLNSNTLTIAWDHLTGSSQRLLGVNITGSGDIKTVSGTDLSIDTNLNLAAGVNLIVIRFTDKTLDGAASDKYDLWLNPDLGNPGAASYSASIASGLAPGAANYGFDAFYVNAGFNGVNSVYFDELRLGQSFAEVTPLAAVPEPTAASLLAIGVLGFLSRRRR